MSVNLAERVKQVKISPTLALSAKAAKMRAAGKDIISLATGEPDFDTPAHIKQAAIAAIEAGFTKYTAVDGIPELKEAIRDKFKQFNHLNYELNQILVSTGGKQCIYNLCQALLQEGDEVLIPAPYWVSYPDIVLLADAKPVIIPSTPAQYYKITAEQLAASITPNTKLLFLNSPSNPSGIAYTDEELRALGAVLEQHPKIWVASDDIYEHILFSRPFNNILNLCPSLYERCIILNGLSKAYSMTGWRVGYAAGPAALIEAMLVIQSQSTSNPCSIAQKAGVAALRGDQSFVQGMVKSFKERHDYVLERLSSLSGVEVIPADGTFYIFPSFQELIIHKGYANDLALSEDLLQKTGIALVPGSAFGTEGCLRISFATSMDNLCNALNRLASFCS